MASDLVSIAGTLLCLLGVALMAILLLTVFMLPRSIGRRPPGSPTADLPVEARAEVERLVAEGRPIHAVRLVHQHTGWSLQQSKDHVDAIRRGDASPPAHG